MLSLMALCNQPSPLFYSRNDGTNFDSAELFKITSFIRMTSKVNRIYIPVGLCDPNFSEIKEAKRGSNQKTLAQLLETWPLVQSFGLEGLGRGGFFTMHHETSPLDIHPVLTVLDTAAVYARF